MDQQKTKYALVGTGGRATMFLDPIATTYKNNTEIVGLCDMHLNTVRCLVSQLLIMLKMFF